MDRITNLFQNNTILRELCNKTYKAEFKNRNNKLQRGLISNKKIDEIFDLNEFIRQDIIQDINEISNTKVLRDYKSYKSIGSINDLVFFTTRVISELLNIKPTSDHIKLIKENINLILKSSLNESVQEINENTKLDIFFKWVAKPILESNSTEINLDELNLPTMVKILVENKLDEYLTIYNNLSVEQLYEQVDISSENIVRNMNASDIIGIFSSIINHINAEWEDESIPLHNLELNTDKITVESLIDMIIKNNNKEYDEYVENIVESYLNGSQSKNNEIINSLVTIKSDKSNYINLMSSVFREFDKFLDKYDLRKKISNWTKDHKIHQSFVSIIGELMLASKNGFKSDNLHRSVFTNNMIFVMEQLIDGFFIESNKNELLHTISDLYSDLGRIDDIFNSLSNSEKNELKKWMMDDVTADNIRHYIEEFKFKLRDIINYIKPIMNEKETNDGHIYTLNYYIIPYQFIKNLNPNISENADKIRNIRFMEGKSIREIKAALKKVSDDNKKSQSSNTPSNIDVTNPGIRGGVIDDDKTKPGR